MVTATLLFNGRTAETAVGSAAWAAHGAVRRSSLPQITKR
ncbi:hypothetical protein HMPREF9062_0836 [Actinomyces sp. oral taxon 448 str. F0400]|nr:hypothetical protein HMPREF9062_0836 [Actinomyces sp. oral taxon 448 str. F0400]